MEEQKELDQTKLQEIKRHSLAHLMVVAILKLYPKAKFGIGPVIENGFYYDVDFGDISLTQEDLPKIQKLMKEMIKEKIVFERKDISLDEAEEIFKSKNQDYKLELIKDLREKGTTLIDGEKNDVNQVSIYSTGEFVDLCRGPHIEDSKKLKSTAFKLMSLAGAYWRGDEKNKMLTRIYAVAFESRDELNEYLEKLAEAEKRDHRKIGKEQNLFMVNQTVGQGLIMWEPKGAMLWRVMEDFWYQEHLRGGYELVRTPHIGSRKLWETSGHWGFYSDSMYPPLEVGQSLQELQAGKKAKMKEEYLLKPMNCPFHVMIYNNRPRSYKELPVRWAECGTVYRYEKSGELSGLTRVRGFTQDDAHIICSKDQVKEELKRVVNFIKFIFSSFGFFEYKICLSLRDSHNQEKYSGSDEGWDFTQKTLEEVAQEEKLDYTKEEGEAAFYGPKIDFKIKDSLGREWQCSTLQFDFNLPERFNMTFVNDKGEEERPYMLHRALFGSFERFIGLLIENYAGAFPLWLSPVQIKIISVGEGHIDYCKKLADEFKSHDLRVEVDFADETVGNKIRKSVKERNPYMLVIGDKEMSSDKLSVRVRCSEDLLEIEKKTFIENIKEKIEKKEIDL